MGCIDELRDLVACALERVGGLDRELVGASVDVRVVRRVVVDHRIDDGLGFQGSRRAIEVDERFSVDLLMERRKVLPNGQDVESRCGRLGDRRRCPLGSVDLAVLA